MVRLYCVTAATTTAAAATTTTTSMADSPILGHCIFLFEASQQYIFLYGHGGSLMLTPHPGELDFIPEFSLLWALVSLT